VVTDTAAKEPIPTWSDYFQLLRFVLPRYDLVLVDLPEVVNTATAEVVRTARAVYLVTTPELPSLALAQQRFHELARWGVEETRQFAVLNRWHKHDPMPTDVAEILNHPVAAVVGNDYRAVQRVITKSKLLGVDNDVGAAFRDFAYVLAGEPNPHANKPKAGRLRLFRAS
jgi:Flp pilus assembly CpaE family ATPase